MTLGSARPGRRRHVSGCDVTAANHCIGWVVGGGYPIVAWAVTRWRSEQVNRRGSSGGLMGLRELSASQFSLAGVTADARGLI